MAIEESVKGNDKRDSKAKAIEEKKNSFQVL